MAKGENQVKGRRARITRRGKHGPLASGPSDSVAASVGLLQRDTSLSQSSDNLDKFAVSGEVRSDAMGLRRSVLRRLPQVDAAGPDRERVAWRALAAFGDKGAAGADAAAPGGDPAATPWPAERPLPPVAAVGRDPRDSARAEPEEVGTDLIGEEAETDVSAKATAAEADIDREWADNAPTVKDSAPTPR